MFVPMRGDVVVHRVKPKKKAPRALVDIDVPGHGIVHRHVAKPRHVDVLKHADAEYADVPKSPRRRHSLHLPSTGGFQLPADPAPRHHHHDAPREPRHHHRLPFRSANPFVPDPPRCALRCGNARIKGSPYCLNDTCQDASCNHQSRVWGGYCKEHGCGAGNCRRRRLVSIVPVRGQRGVERGVESDYCGVHSCRSWGCGGAGARKFGGFCEKHYLCAFPRKCC